VSSSDSSRPDRDALNASRFDHANANGFYESYFQRANHPSEPRAFWIRYTVFSPRGRPAEAVGQLWAVYFDGASGRHVALKRSVPISECSFSREAGLDVRVGDARLEEGTLHGTISQHDGRIAWELTYAGDEPPLLLFERASYQRRFPSAKALCGTPLAIFHGSVTVNDATVPIDRWVGTQNHNWGSRHTDRYAWGQVAGFDDDPTAVLECSTAKLKLGPVRTPPLSLLVLRLGDREFACNSVYRALRTRGAYDYFSWRLDAEQNGTHISASFDAPKAAFVGLSYENPPGGTKTCLNTKVAGCRLVVEEPGKAPRRIGTESRAAFEILTDDDSHGVPVLV
jgi:hypothetical protein